MYVAHDPVLKIEVLKFLKTSKNKNFIDCTLGSGGHAEAILEKTAPKGRLLGIDLDQEAVDFSSKRLLKFGARVIIVRDNFVNLKNIIESQELRDIDGILIDLGVSSHQLAAKRRGFSYQKEGKLDMRFGESVEIDALKIINEFSEEDLAKIIREFGEIRQSRRIARKIAINRKKKKITTTKELAEIIKESVYKSDRKAQIKLLSRAFQAIRIAVNNELENIREVLLDAIDLLKKGGRLVVISYHSLEDRIVKNIFSQEEKECICPPEIFECRCGHVAKVKKLNKKPVIPSENEIKNNPKSRSAKMRAVEKI